MNLLWDSLYQYKPNLRSEKEILDENTIEECKLEVEIIENGD